MAAPCPLSRKPAFRQVPREHWLLHWLTLRMPALTMAALASPSDQRAGVHRPVRLNHPLGSRWQWSLATPTSHSGECADVQAL
jgi:hypothetical protein